MARKCEDWLWTLMDYVEETETPRHFWLWGGISTLASTLQRKVWLPFGRKKIYPSMYIMLVAPPGECRKASPLEFSEDMLREVDIPRFADSPTKRALTKALDKVRGTQMFKSPDGKGAVMHSSMTIISKEFGTFVAVDPKAMIDALTDLWDTHDEWKYETSGEGEDVLRNLCLNAFLATTPGWIAENLPEQAIGGGFTTRLIIVTGTEKYKWLSLPPEPSPDLYLRLRHDLKNIKANLIGEFSWGPDAYDYYDAWYMTLEEKTKRLRDRRLRGNLSRIHVQAIKTAMCIHVSYSDELIITLGDIEKAIKLNEEALKTAGVAFEGHGRSKTSADTEKVIHQLRIHGEIEFRDLLAINFRDTNKQELMVVLETIEGMGTITIHKTCDNFGAPKFGRIKWLGGSSTGRGGRRRESVQIMNPLRPGETLKEREGL